MADFIYIDGIEYEADKELIDLIKNHANSSLDKGDKDDNDFERKTDRNCYYYIGQDGKVQEDIEMSTPFDNDLYKIGNYCANKKLLKKRAAEETLLRKMWRFSLTHDGDKIDWDNEDTQKWYLSIASKRRGVVVSFVNALRQIGVIYFNSEEVAEEAKKEFGKEFQEVYGTTNN